MKSFDILRKVKRGCTQENWVVCVNPVIIHGREIFLHTLFINGNPLKKYVFVKYSEYELGEYGNFLNKYNGVNIFSGSLSVFGYNFSATNAKFHPDDIGVENAILHDDTGRLYIARLGEYLFSLKKGEEKIYCTRKGSDEDIFEWDNFDEFFVYIFKSLAKLYDDKGLKLNPNVSKFPSVINRTIDFEEVKKAHELVAEEEKELGLTEVEDDQPDEDDEQETDTEETETVYKAEDFVSEILGDKEDDDKEEEL